MTLRKQYTMEDVVELQERIKAMTDVHCTGHVDYNPKKTTDFGYEMEIDNDGEIQITDRSHTWEILSTLYISKSDVEEMVNMLKEFENGSQD